MRLMQRQMRIESVEDRRKYLLSKITMDEMGARIDAIDTETRTLSGHVSTLSKRVDVVEEKYRLSQRLFADLGGRIDGIDTENQTLSERVEVLGKRLDVIEEFQARSTGGELPPVVPVEAP